ncbi:MAG: hypothetical protein JRF56_07630 [Deltaproteobacteria bacterium]|jgi:hypothetical protein|nr:hypothetical protein [Deltaproteobacteria bacterium]
MNSALIRTSLLATSFAFLASFAIAQTDIRTERVRFEKGANSAIVEGSITGYETVDYILGAQKGQYMNVSMATDNSANCFNILAPGENQVAMFNGSIAGNQYEGTLPKSGDYKVRVYMMRSAARRNEVANFRLEMIISGGKKLSDGAGHSEAASNAATRAGKGDFDATGQIPCAQYSGQPVIHCNFGVSRDGGGTATAVITRPDGKKSGNFLDQR